MKQRHPHVPAAFPRPIRCNGRMYRFHPDLVARLTKEWERPAGEVIETYPARMVLSRQPRARITAASLIPDEQDPSVSVMPGLTVQAAIETIDSGGAWLGLSHSEPALARTLIRISAAVTLPRSATSHPPPDDLDFDGWRDLAQAVADCAADLSPWQQQFLANLRRVQRLNGRQRDGLRRIVEDLNSRGWQF